jgi:hypothetical protein
MFFDLLTRRSDKNRIGWRKSVCVGCVSVCVCVVPGYRVIIIS